jgi:hypothetical protein
LLPAPRIDPVKVISGMRRTATGLPVIAELAAPGTRPPSDGTVPAARRSDRLGRSAAGQITAGGTAEAPPAGLETPGWAGPANARHTDRRGPAVVGVAPGSADPVADDGRPALHESSIRPPEGCHHNGGRAGRCPPAGAIGTGPASCRRT